jgi:hypothetical protein
VMLLFPAPDGPSMATITPFTLTAALNALLPR